MVQKWQLNCYLLYLGKPHEFDEYTIDGNIIKACDLVKDLGVQSDKLKFHNHATFVTESQSSTSNYSETFQHFDKVTLINLQNLCMAVLEYGNIIWRPQYIKNQQEIKKV